MENKAEIVELTSDIVAAYVGNNAVPSSDLPSLINDDNEPFVWKSVEETDKSNHNDIRMATELQINYVKSQIKKKNISLG